MDIQNETAASGLTMQQSRDWLSALSTFHATPENISEVFMDRLPGRVRSQLKASGVDAAGLMSRANAMVNWCRERGLIEQPDYATPTHPQWQLSPAGRRVVASSLNARKSSEKAWDEVAGMLARALWNNLSDPSIAPLSITDIVLFGSMTCPDQGSYGDADVVVLTQYRGATAKDREKVRRAADLKARDVYGLSPAVVVSGTNWNNLCLSNLRAGRSFISLASSAVFSQFSADGAPATGFSLFGNKIAGGGGECAHVLPPDPTVASRLQEQLNAACSRLGLPWLPEALSGMPLEDGQMKQLAEVAVTPLVRRCATRLSTALFQQNTDNDGGVVDFMPEDSTRAFWWASGHPAGIDPAFYACQQINGSGVLAVGAASRAFRGSASSIGHMWEASYQDAMTNSNLTENARAVLQREFDGDVSHRIDLVPGKKCYKAPLPVTYAALRGDWDAVRAWTDRGGAPACWLGDEDPGAHSEPWSLLLGVIRASPHLSGQKTPVEWIQAFVGAGFSLDATNKYGETAKDQALRFGIAEPFEKGVSEASQNRTISTGPSLLSSISRRRSSIKDRSNRCPPAP